MKHEADVAPESIVYSSHVSKSCIPLLLKALQPTVEEDAYWQGLLERANQGIARLHVGIFIEPYLQLVLEGKKTLESRFSVNQSAPYGRVRNGDILLLKRSGGPIVAISQITEAWSYVLDTSLWADIKHNHAQALCIQSPSFWEEKSKANYATLMRLRHTRTITPGINFVKSDRRGWVVL